MSVTKENMLSVIELDLRDMGVMSCVIEDILNELKTKSYNVQATFYYRMNGYSQEQVAEMLGVTQVRIVQYVTENLKKVKEILLQRM